MLYALTRLNHVLFELGYLAELKKNTKLNFHQNVKLYKNVHRLIDLTLKLNSSQIDVSTKMPN